MLSKFIRREDFAKTKSWKSNNFYSTSTVIKFDVDFCYHNKQWCKQEFFNNKIFNICFYLYKLCFNERAALQTTSITLNVNKYELNEVFYTI